MPPFAAPSAYLPQQYVATTPTTHLPPPPPPPTAAVRDRFAEVADTDREDGEVSDGDRIPRSPAGYSQPIPEPPRSAPQAPQASFRAGNWNEGRGHSFGGTLEPPRNNDHFTTNRMDSDPSRPHAKQQMLGSIGWGNLAQKREDAQQFVKTLYDNSIGYPSLKREGLDPRLLEDLYRCMNLPLVPEVVQTAARAPVPAPIKAPTQAPVPKASAPGPPPARAPIQTPKPAPVTERKVIGGLTSDTANGYQAVRYPGPPTTDAVNPQAKPTPAPAVKTNVNQGPPVKSAPSPIDRKDYIARLQAAKMAKQSVGNKATPPQQTPPPKAAPVTDPAPTAAVKVSQSSTISNGDNAPKTKQPVTEEEKARKTELIRQRLEAMKAKQTASTPTAPQTSKPVTPLAASAAVPLMPSLQNVEHVQTPTPQPAPLPQPNESTQSSQSFRTPSFSGIPGLFMTASTVPKTAAPVRPMQSPPFQSPPNQSQNTAATSIKKRAVASDFDEVTTPTSSGPAYNRPFGQSPHDHDVESMIVDVSEDDLGGSEMDLDDDQPASKPAVVSQLESNQTAQQRLRNFPPLSDFPTRAESIKPASSAVSTPGPQTPATLARKEELQKKEKDLADLKQKLVLKLQEQRQKTAAAAALSPKPPKVTAQTTPKQSDPLTKLTHPLPKRVDLRESLQPTGPSTTLNSATQNMARELKKRRRAEIESGLPSLEAEIANNTARMAQIAKEMEELKANNEKISQDKENLIRELEGLGIDTEGMPHAVLQAKKDEIDHVMEAQNLNSPSQLSTVNAEGNSVVPDSTLRRSNADTINAGDNSPSSHQTETVVLVPEVDMTVPEVPLSVTQPEVAGLPTANDGVALEPKLNGGASLELPRADNVPQSNQQKPTDCVSTTVEIVNGSATPVDDGEDFYSPEETVTVALENETVIKEALGPNARSPSGEGEVEMSQSSSSEDEEEYEPEEPQAVHSMNPNPDNHSVDILGSPASCASTQPDDEEMYEPPEPEINDHPDSTNAASDLHPVEEDGAMDISTSSSDESDESDSVEQFPSEQMNNNLISINNASDLSIAVADHSAPQPQFQTVPVSQTTTTKLVSATEDVIEPASFVPYESPLRMFKSYRYHPSFSKDVPGGFLSMTYSHQIDPDKPLCQCEAEGGTCNDPTCTNQHFRAMKISGEKLLVQLGTANPGKTPDEKQLWNDGLRGVLRELRHKGTKDTIGIAVEIAKYRRQFLNDDTRVVSL